MATQAGQQAPDGGAANGTADGDKVAVRVEHARTLSSVLQCIKAGNKQNCNVSFASDGMSVRWEDDSKALQGSVFLKPELFASFYVPPQHQPHEFGLPLHTLLDTLAVFATSSAMMALYFPGQDGELICEAMDDSYDQAVGTWARICSLASEAPHDLGDYWTDPASYFLAPGALLKEAVEDLEWPGGDVEVVLQRDPQAIRLKAVGNGTLEVELPSSQLSGFSCSCAEVRCAYKHKHLKAAFCNLPNPKDGTAVQTKVSIDSNGLLKVTHMLTLGGARQQPALDHASALLQSQRLYEAAKVAVVTFMVQPAEEEGA